MANFIEYKAIIESDEGLYKVFYIGGELKALWRTFPTEEEAIRFKQRVEIIRDFQRRFISELRELLNGFLTRFRQDFSVWIGDRDALIFSTRWLEKEFRSILEAEKGKLREMGIKPEEMLK